MRAKPEAGLKAGARHSGPGRGGGGGGAAAPPPPHKDVGLDPFPTAFRNHIRTGGGPGAGADEIASLHSIISQGERSGGGGTATPAAHLPRRTLNKGADGDLNPARL